MRLKAYTHIHPKRNPVRLTHCHPKMRKSKFISGLRILLLCLLIDHPSLSAKYESAFDFENLKLVDSVICTVDSEHEFLEYPQGISSVSEVLGSPVRVLANDSGQMKYFAYRLGAGKSLVADKGYVLRIVYPEDKPRSYFILNRGCETIRGFHTGNTTGDGMKVPYVPSNPESLVLPLSGEFESWNMLFFLQEQYPALNAPRQSNQPRNKRPEDGFWVFCLQLSPENDPLSAGVAVERIELYEAPAAEELIQPLAEVPSELPKRHLFWREEMSDGVIDSADPASRGFEDDMTWFDQKFRLMRFLGMRTFAKDLLEFGHNQGWDSSKFGGDPWIKQPHNPELWERLVKRCGAQGFDVIPYFEYSGSKNDTNDSLGYQRRARPLAIEPDFTHITWVEAANVDITDPDTFEDIRRILEITVTDQKTNASFAAVWLRTRVSDWPISFADPTLKRFETDTGNPDVTRSALIRNEGLYHAYVDWWFDQRQVFLQKVSDYLKAQVDPNISLLFTADSTEQGKPLLSCFETEIVAENPSIPPLSTLPNVSSLDEALAGNWYLKSLTSPSETWETWEWQHAVPHADPHRYRDTHGIYLTQTVNRAYTMDRDAFDAFRTSEGLAAIRFYPLNEDATEVDGDNRLVGYFVADVDYAGPFVVLPEALAFAHGDPRFLGYLSSNNFNRGNPYYVRRFNANFLALPALPSTIETEMSADPNLVVRSIITPSHGEFLGAVHIGRERKTIQIRLPKPGSILDAVSGKTLFTLTETMEITFDPFELRSFIYFPNPETKPTAPSSTTH